VAVAFHPRSQSVEWITTSLQTITPKHQDFQQISIHVRFGPSLTGAGVDVRQTVGERILGEWSDLDRLLVKFWESRSIRPEVISTMINREQGTIDWIGCLLPEVTKRDLVLIVQDIEEE